MKLVIRVDGDGQIGSGHVFRCLALAEGWKGHVVFAYRILAEQLKQRVRAAGYEMLQLEEPSDMPEGDRYVIDGYHLPATLQEHHPALVIDDGARVGTYHCALVTDPSPLATAEQYPGARQTLLGPKFALTSARFLKQRPPTPEANHDGPVVVTLGGNAPLAAWRPILAGLTHERQVELVVGGQQEHVDEIAGLLPNARLHQHTHDLAPLLRKARVAILAGGSTNWEACVTGTPRLVVTFVANQVGVAKAIEVAGAGRSLGSYLSVKPQEIERQVASIRGQTLERMAWNAWQMCDGRGPERVVAALEAA